jgi:glycerol-3-phosphate dehydrogenase
MNIRENNWSIADNKLFDVAIIGAGINGAAVYKRLCSEGYKVLIMDKGDFSCGTSQTSAMMIWGGLLYLRNLDISTVYSFSKDRDALIDSCDEQVSSRTMRYIVNSKTGLNKYLVYLALHFYWLLGHCKRKKPGFQKDFEELGFLKRGAFDGSILYQEGYLKQSDSRFVLDWILSCQSEDSIALNYCLIGEGNYNSHDKLWSLSLSDALSNRQCVVKAKVLLNCAGVWTDRVNERFGIKSPYKHVFSKGVFIGFKRPDTHRFPLVFEMGEHGDALAFIPWGPVSLWGPTETITQSIEEGYTTDPDDIRFLLKHAAKNLTPSLVGSNIVSIRCGLRPLVVKKDFEADCYPLELSRRSKVIEDPDVPWISVYGGKISGCISLAEVAAIKVSRRIRTSLEKPEPPAREAKAMRWSAFPGVDERVPTIDWCVENEFCCTLEDYLRRRTNISQWVPRQGLGSHNENMRFLEQLAFQLPADYAGSCVGRLQEYVGKVHGDFDRLMKSI